MTPKYKLVVIESPLAGDVEANVAYAKECMRDSLRRGEAPYASHLLYAQPGILDDLVPEERTLGIEVGLAWAEVAELTAVYIDRGVSKGMRYGIERAIAAERLVVTRSLRGLPESVIQRCPSHESGGVQCILPQGHEDLGEGHRCEGHEP